MNVARRFIATSTSISHGRWIFFVVIAKTRNNPILIPKVAMSRLTRFPRILAERLNFFAKSRGSENNVECPGTSGRQSSGSGERLRKWAFELSGYNKFGLYTDDVLNHTIPSVAKALERLPGDVVDDRNYRLIRAIQLDFLKIHLPRDQWITYEDDRDYRYLTPYVAEVEAEWREIYEFGCTNYRHE